MQFLTYADDLVLQFLYLIKSAMDLSRILNELLYLMKLRFYTILIDTSFQLRLFAMQIRPKVLVW